MIKIEQIKNIQFEIDMLHPKTLAAIVITVILFAILFGVNYLYEIPNLKSYAWMYGIVIIIAANIAAEIWYRKSQRKN